MQELRKVESSQDARARLLLILYLFDACISSWSRDEQSWPRYTEEQTSTLLLLHNVKKY